jgi:hypothetical protein
MAFVPLLNTLKQFYTVITDRVSKFWSRPIGWKNMLRNSKPELLWCLREAMSCQFEMIYLFEQQQRSKMAAERMDFYGLRAKFKCRSERLGPCSDLRRDISMNTNHRLSLLLLLFLATLCLMCEPYKAHIGAANKVFLLCGLNTKQ